MKLCSKCRVQKDLSDFNARAAVKDGRQSVCRSCQQLYWLEYCRANGTKLAAKRTRDKGDKAAYDKRYYASNKIKMNAANRENWALNRERYNRRHSEYYAENVERFRLYHQRPDRRAYASVNAKNQKAKRRAAMGATVQKITTAEWRELAASYHWLCVYCHVRPGRLTMDHIVPLTLGGAHTVANVVPACRNCNSKKNTKNLVHFMVHRRRAA